MTHVLVIANDVIGERMAGPAIRAWELSRALHARGLRVTLAAPGDSIPAAAFETRNYELRGGALRGLASEADAMLVQGLVLAHYPFLAAVDKPLVVDIYDPFVLENLQARSGQLASGRRRHHESDLEVLCGQLARGDFFVCASDQQRDFWLGMLTALGRVNPATYDADPALRHLIDVVPFGVPDDPPSADRPALRGVVPGIARGDFVVLWGGGIWNWFDPLTLIRAAAALRVDRPSLRVYFMGGAPPSLYPPEAAMAGRAEALARDLGLLDGTVFFNREWVPYRSRGDYLLEADVGASFHLDHIETRYAFRTRLLDSVWAGLPMLVTGGDVMADLVARERLGLVVPPADVEATTVALRTLMDEPGGRASYAERFASVRCDLAWSRAVEPLVRFLASPARAPDRPVADAGAVAATPTPLMRLPARALEIVRDGGPLYLLEESVRYVRWLRRGGR